MTINHPGFDFDSLRRFAETVRGVSQLPGIPTASWGTQAAACVSRLIPGSIATFRLVEALPSGEFAGTLCVGAYDAHNTTELDPSLLMVEGECLAAWWMLSTSRAVELNGTPLSGAVRHAPGCDRWEFSALGRRWASMGQSEVWVGAKSCGKTAPGRPTRWAIVELGDRTPEAASREHIPEMLRAVMPELSQRAALAFSATAGAASDATLTHREYEVLTLLSRGLTVKQIAETLSRSPHTVHDHVKALHRKLGASSRGELVARALGHIDPEGNLVRHDQDDHAEAAANRVVASVG